MAAICLSLSVLSDKSLSVTQFPVVTQLLYVWHTCWCIYLLPTWPHRTVETVIVMLDLSHAVGGIACGGGDVETLIFHGIVLLTHLPLVPHICVCESSQHWFR